MDTNEREIAQPELSAGTKANFANDGACGYMERAMGIEPTSEAWEAEKT
jgi:hypothetical protein